MRWGLKTLSVALVVLLLGWGLVACGGGDDSDTGTTDAAQTQTSTEGGQAGSGDGGSDVARANVTPKPGGEGDSKDSSAEFSPKQHQDSGGGAEQFRVKGGDNSVQEFGGEAEGTEFDEAATALHNFLDARAAGAWAAACEYMAESVIESLQELATQSQQLKGAACAAILGKLTNPAAKDLLHEEAERADVGSLRVEGERGFVLFHGPDGEVLVVPMAREDGTWKVAALASTPLS